ncbi:MAG: AAA family ATPase [Ignavibacteria bacterium]|nr:AAA family ATPase [Ignavibacteria bacterium]
MKRLPLGIQTFSHLMGNDYIYVDKTGFISRLIDSHKYAFLARPRRFGKSLFLSTLEGFFLGNKELFSGLALYDYPNWQKHPVIRLDFSDMELSTLANFSESLMDRFKEIANEENLDVQSNIPSNYFSSLIKELYKKYNKGVVILVDEYDKPLTDHLYKTEIALSMRDFLQSVFARIKASDEYIRFVFITGISKFSKVSLFSGLNQMSDISMNKEFGTLFGYTQTELKSYFGDRISILADEFGISNTELLQKVKFWYNGYSWDGEEKLYNPFSILNFLKNGKFENYWFSTGTPSQLIKFIENSKPGLDLFRNVTANYYTFDVDSLTNISAKNFLFQTGYLTIKEKKSIKGEEEFLLDFPNYEVQSSYFDYLFANAANRAADDIKTKAKVLKDALEESDFTGFEEALRFLFAQIPSNLHIEQERFYHSLFIMIMYLSGIEVEAEVSTNIGRIDGVMEFPDKIYILEFKFNLPPEEGLKQILAKKYYEKYLSSGKKIFLVGVGFTRQDIKVSWFENNT